MDESLSSRSNTKTQKVKINPVLLVVLFQTSLTEKKQKIYCIPAVTNGGKKKKKRRIHHTKNM